MMLFGLCLINELISSSQVYRLLKQTALSLNNFSFLIDSGQLLAEKNSLKIAHMHRLEINAIVWLFSPLFIKFKSCLQKRPFISM